LIYLDASALVTIVVGRRNFTELDDFLDAHGGVRTCTSTVGFVETIRTCDQIGMFPNLMASLARDHTQISLDNDIRDAAARMPGNVRALDAIHVASAQVLGSELTALVTYDKGMAEVARAIGLPVAMPCTASS
jgi:predicted nucleic acid-binding protein